MSTETISSPHINSCPLCQSKTEAILSPLRPWKIRCTNKKCRLTYGGDGVDNAEWLIKTVEQWNRLVAVDYNVQTVEIPDVFRNKDINFVHLNHTGVLLEESLAKQSDDTPTVETLYNKGLINPVSLSDCVKCFDTPCVCGYHYRKMDKSLRIERAATILGIDKNKLIKLVDKITPEKHPMFDEKDI